MIEWGTVAALAGIISFVLGLSTTFLTLFIGGKLAGFEKMMRKEFIPREALLARLELLEARMTATCACVEAAFPRQEENLRGS